MAFIIIIIIHVIKLFVYYRVQMFPIKHCIFLTFPTHCLITGHCRKEPYIICERGKKWPSKDVWHLATCSSIWHSCKKKKHKTQNKKTKNNNIGKCTKFHFRFLKCLIFRWLSGFQHLLSNTCALVFNEVLWPVKLQLIFCACYWILSSNQSVCKE